MRTRPRSKREDTRAFNSDERAVSEVLGAMLIFAVLIAALGAYQAFVVPAENNNVEINHELDVNDDLVDVRGAIIESGLGNTVKTATVDIGARYADRTFTINPPDPAGELYTTDPEGIVITEMRDGEEVTITSTILLGENETTSLVYEANFNEYDGSGPVVYEHSLVYQIFDGSTLDRSEQRLVEGDEVTIISLVGDVDANGFGKVDLEFRPGFLIRDTVESPTITLPTQLEDEEAWEELLADELVKGEDDEGTLKNVSIDEDGMLVLEFEGTITITGLPVGINENPEGGPREDNDVGTPGVGDGGGINPLGPLWLSGVESARDHELDDAVELTFEHVGEEPLEIDTARFTLQFRGHSEADKPTDAIKLWDDEGNIIDEDDCEDGELQVGGEPCDLDPTITLTPGDELTIFVSNADARGHDLITVLEFGVNDRRLQYMFSTSDID